MQPLYRKLDSPKLFIQRFVLCLDMMQLLELLKAPLMIFENLGLSPFQAFVVIGMLSSGAIMNWTYNFNNHDDDDDDHDH